MNSFIDQITCFSFIFITFIFIPILNWHWSTDNPHETILWMNKKNIYENLFSGMQTFIAKTTKKTTLKMDSKTMGKTQILLRPSNSINKNCFMNCSTFISTWTHHAFKHINHALVQHHTYTRTHSYVRERIDLKHLSTLLIRILDSVYALLLSALNFSRWIYLYTTPADRGF